MHNGKNSLVILTPGFAASEHDSSCLPMHQLFVSRLKKEFPDLNIIVLAFHYPFDKKQYNLFGADIRSFGGANKTGLAAYLMRRNVRRELKEIHSSYRLIGILSFWYGECAIVGKKFADVHNIPHYCWILGQDARAKNFFPHRLKPDPAELIALSDFLQDEFERNHGIRPKHVIPPGIDAKQFSNLPAERDIDILGVGSLIPLKQYDILIDMVAKIKKELPDIRVQIVGDGPERKRLQNLVAEHGLQSNIQVSGELPYDHVLQLMQRTKLLLHPSSYEGFSGVCMEALYAGAHVISFCRAMKFEIRHWHMVDSKEAMYKMALTLLRDTENEFNKVEVFPIKDTVVGIKKLFDRDDPLNNYD